jgi:Flp pilus assembly protein protease CpaA
MPVNYIILAAEIITSLFIPTPLMKYKKKEDICSKGTKIFAVIASTVCLSLSGCFLAAYEPGLLNFCLMSLFLMLSSVIIQVDTRCRIIPNLCLFPMLVLSAVYIGFNYSKPWIDIPTNIFTMIIICMALMGLSSTIFRGYFGAGDIKYLSVCGLLFGTSIGMIGTLAGMVASLLIYLIPMLIAKKLTMKSFIAFGPFIGIGAMLGVCLVYYPIYFVSF